MSSLWSLNKSNAVIELKEFCYLLHTEGNQFEIVFLKFRYGVRRPQNLKTNLSLFLKLPNNDKMMRFFQIFMAFSEYLNFRTMVKVNPRLHFILNALMLNLFTKLH